MEGSHITKCFLILIVLSLSASIWAETGSADTLLSQDDVAVILATIKQVSPPHYGKDFHQGLAKKEGVWHYSGPTAPAVFCLQETSVSLDEINHFLRSYAQGSPSNLPESLVSALKDRNERPVKIPAFDATEHIRLVSTETMEAMRNGDSSKTPEDFGGMGEISLPTYQDKGNTAVVFFSYGFEYAFNSETRGAGGWGIYLLKKDNGTWKIDKEFAIVT